MILKTCPCILLLFNPTHQVLSQVRPNRGLQRVDSFSFYVQNILGPELRRFQEEAAKHSVAARTEAEARSQLEDIARCGGGGQGGM